MPSSKKQTPSLTQAGQFSEIVSTQSQKTTTNNIRKDAGPLSSTARYSDHIKHCSCEACKNRIGKSEQRPTSKTGNQAGNNTTGSIDPSKLISRAFGDITKAYLNGQETLNYFLYDSTENLQYLGNKLQTLQYQNDSIEFIGNIFARLDPLIDLDFKATSNPNEADLTIISVEDWEAWDNNTVGEVINLDDGWHVLWKDVYQDSLKGNASGSSDSFDANTIAHEIGHALGLSHPNEDPFNRQWTTDETVMSYNVSPNGWGFSFTAADIDALQRIWGEENDNISPNASPVLTGRPAFLPEGREDFKYILSAADLLQGYSDPNGDRLLISGLSAEYGALSDNNNQSWTFTPVRNFNGEVNLSYSVDDGSGGSVAAKQSFRITPINDDPLLTGNPASLKAGKEKSAYTITEQQLLQGYSDPDGDALFVTNLAASNGALRKTKNQVWAFTPTKTFNGTVKLTYSIRDGGGGSVQATNRFDIEPVHQSPTPTSGAQNVEGTDPLMRGEARETPRPAHASENLHDHPIKVQGALDTENTNIIQSKGKQSNKIKGTSGDDYLLAGKGADILIGKGGADQFLFTQNDRFGRRGTDIIKDFNIDEGDRLVLSPKRLRGLDSDPSLAIATKKKQLKKLARTNIDVIYFEPKGQIIYNQNDKKSGFGAGGMFAVLANEPELSNETIHFMPA